MRTLFAHAHAHLLSKHCLEIKLGYSDCVIDVKKKIIN